MNTGRINYVFVGAFILAMAAGLLVVIGLLTGRTGSTDDYHAVYRNVTGVKFGTQVLYEGYPIGQVTKVTPEEKAGRMTFRVDFEVNAGWRIPTDSMAEIKAPGLLSAITLSIAAGASKASLKPGDQVLGSEADNFLTTVSGVASQINDLAENNLKPLLEGLTESMRLISDLVKTDGRTLIADGRALIDDYAVIAKDLAERAPRIAHNLETFSEGINQNSQQVSQLLSAANRGRVENAITNLDAATKGLKATTSSLNDMVAAMDGMVGDNRESVNQAVADLRHVAESLARHIDATNQNMEGAARNLNEFSRQIRQNPGLLLGGTAPKDRGAAK